jgi:hypothetical protein
MASEGEVSMLARGVWTPGASVRWSPVYLKLEKLVQVSFDPLTVSYSVILLKLQKISRN